VTQTPPAPESVFVSGPAGPLAALVEVPAGYDGRRCAVICHPHPLYGGTMTNKVVHMTARALQERGYATLRFNFRGVGASAGTFDDGIGETDDALAACDYAAARWPGASLTLAGFSFGSYVAFRVALQRDVHQLLLIAPPVKRFGFGTTELPRAPWVVIQGDADDVVECSDVTAWVHSLSAPPRLEIIAGAEHFFHGRLTDLRSVVQANLV
jgi:alpha/beta superfamily hydrolase